MRAAGPQRSQKEPGAKDGSRARDPEPDCLEHDAVGWPTARASDTQLVVRDLSFRVAARNILQNIDLEITRPGITAIMGPNGAGKSVLIRLLHGLLTPTTGTISYGGRPMGDAVRAEQAMVFQKPVLLRRSVEDNLSFVLRARKLVADEVPLAARVAYWLAHVRLDRLARQPARQLSGGEQQRLALARALATAPRVLFLDEPTASLDPASQQMIEDILQEAARAGMKIICVTHDAAQARRIAGDVVIMSEGRVIEQHAADPFFNDPQTDAARAYLAGRFFG